MDRFNMAQSAVLILFALLGSIARSAAAATTSITALMSDATGTRTLLSSIDIVTGVFDTATAVDVSHLGGALNALFRDNNDQSLVFATINATSSTAESYVYRARVNVDNVFVLTKQTWTHGVDTLFLANNDDDKGGAYAYAVDN